MSTPRFHDGAPTGDHLGTADPPPTGEDPSTADGCRRRALAFLDDHGARGIAHVNGTLLEHLVGTERLLRSWGAADALALAGLCHAAYGTDGFERSLVPIEHRHALADAVGAVVEESVYFYASCDRTAVYPQLARGEPVVFRDRFTGRVFVAPEDRLRDFVDLTLANECEIAVVGAAAPTAPDWLVDLCAGFAGRAGPGVRHGVRRLLDDVTGIAPP